MGTLKDALKDWKARGRVQDESRQRAEEFAAHAAKSSPARRVEPLTTNAQVDSNPLAAGASLPRVESTVSFATSGVRPLGKSEHFMIPAPWVAKGASLQLDESGTRSLTVRIGIDFGTAYTKVAISAAQKVFFVDWSGVSLSPQPMLLPGVVSVLHGGAAFPGRAEGAARYLSDLKLPLLPGQSSSADEQVAASLYLAWVMRYARGWFFEHQAAICKGRRVVWEVNLGCPTKAWGEKQKVDLYEYLGHAAWQLSLLPELDIKAASNILLGLSRPFNSKGLDLLAVAPEFVAQIAGYSRSPQRRRGLHLLADCGAGTFDVVTFYVHKEGEAGQDQYPIMSSAVEPLGGHFLMGERAKAVGAGLWDDSERIPSAAQLAEAFPDQVAKLVAGDAAFGERLSTVVQRVIDHTRGKRTPLALAWDEGLPLFITGGAASCELYAHAVSSASTRTKGGFRQFSLPQPSGTVSMEDSLFHRLSVAYGLTFDRESLGKVIPEAEIEDFRLSDNMQAKARADRDELYAK